jgi:hypothetical protein
MRNVISILIVGVFFLSGCATRTTPIPSGIIATEGIEIEFIDKPNMVLKSGEEFSIPESMQDPIPWHIGTPKASRILCGFDEYCHKVRVNVPGLNNKLYGVINFAQAYGGSSGPASRSYYIQIPKKYIEAAKNGKASVLYETAKLPNGKHTATWVLWLSDRPL